jgi:hypothetical protein
MEITGCESFRKKFVRQKDTEYGGEVIAIPQDYPLISPEEAYSNHYVYTRCWINEMIERINGGSVKKLKECYEQALYQAYAMKRYLVPEKQEQLQVYIDDINSIGPAVVSAQLSEVEIYRLRHKLEVLLMSFERDFKPSKVKQWIQS